ncbi:MAG: hypothetical protein AAF434_19425 [Pseudomonadota bacterium]
MKPEPTLLKRLALLLLVQMAIACAAWLAFTDRTPGRLSEVLFWVGVGSLIIGVAILCGAWSGFRNTDTDLIMGPSHKRHARSFRDVKRAYSDLNLLALCGCLSIILSLLI